MIGLQTIAVAFAMFSALPVPQFAWNQKNMRYAMCAFPLIACSSLFVRLISIFYMGIYLILYEYILAFCMSIYLLFV